MFIRGAGTLLSFTSRQLGAHKNCKTAAGKHLNTPQLVVHDEAECDPHVGGVGCPREGVRYISSVFNGGLYGRSSYHLGCSTRYRNIPHFADLRLLFRSVYPVV